MNAANIAVLVMARAPRPGQVKTRLQPRLGSVGCARLQAALIRHTVELAHQIAPTATYVAVDPPDGAADLDELTGSTVPVLAQRGPDLGARMSAAVDDVTQAQRGPVVVIGTDAPTMALAHLREAADLLTRGADAVFGPALDGGYYLVAVRTRLPGLFAIDPALWGGPAVLSASLTAAHALGLRTGLLSPLRDLDTPADAEAFLAAGDLPSEISELLHLPEPAR